MSEQKPSHEVKGIVRRDLRQDFVEAQLWGKVPKMSAALTICGKTLMLISIFESERRERQIY